MKRSATLTAALLAITGGGILASAPAIAGPGNHLDWGQSLTASETACPAGDKIVSVVQKVVNALDSGTGLNTYDTKWWATIEYIQHINIVQTAPGEFCATVKSQGSFESVGGDGPGNTGDLAPGIVGTFQGGWTNTFTGDFNNPSGLRTKGNIGTLDPFCDPAVANGGCTGGATFSRYLSYYFSNVSNKALPWWGWVYHAGDNGSWVNAASGNEGDITGE